MLPLILLELKIRFFLPAARAKISSKLLFLNSTARDTNKPKLTAKNANMKQMKAALFLSAFQDHLEEKLLNDKRFVL